MPQNGTAPTAAQEVARAEPGSTEASAEVVLVSRTGCHLCELAEPVVAEQARRAGVSHVVVDVDSDEALRERYTAHVPVLFVRGQLLDYWQVDEGRLADALAGRPVAGPPPL